MKKKALALLMVTAMATSMLFGCGSSGGSSGSAATDSQKTESAAADAKTESKPSSGAVGNDTIKIWVADAVVDFTKEKCAQFQKDNPDYAGFKIVVEAVGEGDAASNMVTDVEAGADIFGFAQDQIARLVKAGALETVNPDYIDSVKAQNDEGSVKAATVGSEVYAYPMTSDNGYFLYYDKSVVTDPTSLEKIVEDCKNAGKNFYMEINSGWYQTAFFFGAGCELTYETDDTGAFTKCNVDYASDKGLVALKELIELKESGAFTNGSAVGEATNLGAIVDGTWDSSAAKDLLGDNYACAPLPSFTGSDGQSYHMSGFGGFKLLGVKPQTDEKKLTACDALAYYLAGEEVQLARYDAVGWGPSNLKAQQSDAVKSDEALSALAEQQAYNVPQGQYPDEYWQLGTSLGDSIISGEIKSSLSDDELMGKLQSFQDSCIGYAK